MVATIKHCFHDKFIQTYINNEDMVIVYFNNEVKLYRIFIKMHIFLKTLFSRVIFFTDYGVFIELFLFLLFLFL